MMQGFIIYEHPLNERIRMMLRLEYLFRTAEHFLAQNDIWSSRVMIATLLDILEILSRGDFRNELLKELERSTGNLTNLMQYPGVNQERLGSILRALEHLIGNIQTMNTPPGTELKNDDFLSAIRQRNAIPGGACDFDLPAYNLWLNGAEDKRLADQQRWYNSLDHVRQAINLLLKMIRGSADPEERLAQDGNYTQQLEKKLPYQLVRVMLENTAPYYAEISGSKHRFTIRYLKPHAGRPEVVTRDINFKLAVCSL